ncbi:MAG: redoxin domain-containing protein [Balneolaceae bacterium]|nr:redoxin domain-containing protein [Balneolaceae bacterium]MBO6546202.1 redoxin domain-containing protein [Balneolaceae bacterium]MBO6648561.1 redoxin domain-containing protein [Balneolaceae bacterium]
MPISENDKAPDFNLQNTKREFVKLSDYEGDRNVVLLFYPLAFSGVCTTELCSIRDNLKIYEAFDAEVIGISIDSFFVQKAFKDSQNLNFQLLSDFNKEAAKSYGVLYEDFFGMKGVAKRSAFVIDKSGVIRYAEILEDSSDIPDFEAIQLTLSELN